MIKTAQRKMLRLIVETSARRTGKQEENDSHCVTVEETGEGSEQNSDKDQDSDVSFQEDSDEEIDKSEKEEEWIEFIKRSTKEAEEHMKKCRYFAG